MAPSYKDLLTIYYNSIIVPKYEWMDGIIVDHLEIVDGLAKGKIRVITNFDTIKGMSPLEFYDKTGGVKGSEITNLLLGGEAESYIGLPKNSINLVYIRAAIEAATGVRLSLEDVRRYLIEEGLITQKQAREEATIFRGYNEFYDYDYEITFLELYSEIEVKSGYF